MYENIDFADIAIKEKSNCEDTKNFMFLIGNFCF